MECQRGFHAGLLSPPSTLSRESDFCREQSQVGQKLRPRRASGLNVSTNRSIKCLSRPPSAALFSRSLEQGRATAWQAAPNATLAQAGGATTRLRTAHLRQSSREHCVQPRQPFQRRKTQRLLAVASGHLDSPADEGGAFSSSLGREQNFLIEDQTWIQKAGDSLGALFKSYFLLFTITSAVILGLLWPAPGQYAQSTLNLTRVCTFAMFFISGLALDARELPQVVKSWPAFLFGIVSALFITPWVSPLITQIPITPVELTSGLALFCMMPSAINVGIALARAADANVTLALAITVATNTAGVFTIPLFLSLFLRPQSGFAFPVFPLLKGLFVSLLVPLSAGMAARASSKWLGREADKRKQALSMTNNILLSMVPWMQVSSARATILQLTPQQILPIALAGLFVHLSFLVLNTAALKGLRSLGFGNALTRKEANAVDRAVILLASQKTLPVAAAVVQKLGTTFGSPALLLLPCILAHFLQVLIDTFVVSQWLKSDAEHEAMRVSKGST